MEHSNAMAITKLLLEIKYPTLEECWQHGYDSTNLNDNPYKLGSASYCHWNDGYWAKEFPEEEDHMYQQEAANDKVCDSDDASSDIVFTIKKIAN